MGYTPPYLDVRRVNATNNSASGGSMTSGDVLRILANAIDAYPRIDLGGLDSIYMYFSNGKGIQMLDATGSSFLLFNWVTPDAQISSFTNYNIALLPQGTGKVKFGTFTGSGDVAVNGSISILDSGGSARKLATVA